MSMFCYPCQETMENLLLKHTVENDLAAIYA